MTWTETLLWLAHAFRLGSAYANVKRGLVVGLGLFLMIYLWERFTGASTEQYRRRGFLHDLGYWFFSRSGLGRLLFAGGLYAVLAPRLAFLNLKVLAGLPVAARYIIYFLVAEFMAYWIHRWQHSNRFLWAFHTTHHSQEHISFLTAHRAHPVDLFIVDVIMFLPLLVLGAPPREWLPIYFLMEILIALQHSQIRWRMGPLYRIVVSPTFHSFHHSVRSEHHNRNFGRILSVWDFVFGTAVDEPQRATQYGLDDVKAPTLVSTLVVPCRLIYETYFRRATAATTVRAAGQ